MCYFARHSLFSSLSKVIGFMTVSTEMVYAKASFCQREWWGSCFLSVKWKLTFYYVMIQHQVFMIWVIFPIPLSIFLYFWFKNAKTVLVLCSQNLKSETCKIRLFKFFNFLFLWILFVKCELSFVCCSVFMGIEDKILTKFFISIYSTSVSVFTSLYFVSIII